MMTALSVAADGPDVEAELRTGNAGLAAARPTAEQLCSRYAATVCRFSAMAAGPDLDADDLAQEALLKAVRSLQSFDPAKGSIDGWLWRIVANTARDSHRAHARRAAVWLRFVARWQEPAENVEDRALESFTRDELVKAIRELNDRDRLLIALRFGADLDLATVGTAVGLNADSTGRAVLRALARLRNRLGGVR
jgi:RNA polymerase sigma factor (sigma-70 family)